MSVGVTAINIRIHNRTLKVFVIHMRVHMKYPRGVSNISLEWISNTLRVNKWHPKVAKQTPFKGVYLTPLKGVY